VSEVISARVLLTDYSNRVLGVIKAKYNLKDKSEALNKFIDIYGTNEVEPELKEEYLEKLKTLEKQKGIPFKSIGELRKIIEG